MVAISIEVRMIDLLKIKNINVYFVIAILITIILNLVFSDTSDLQSAYEIDVAIKPCKLIGESRVETSHFDQGSTQQICGEVFSEYMPLELEYYITDLENSETIVVCEYIKITTRTFTIKLPDNLDAGEYKFELRTGCRKYVAETSFAILP